MNIPENCKGCGKCCAWPSLRNLSVHHFCPTCKDKNRVILLYGKCVYLDDNNECDIYYGNRPNGCTLIQRGSEGCKGFLNAWEAADVEDSKLKDMFKPTKYELNSTGTKVNILFDRRNILELKKMYNLGDVRHKICYTCEKYDANLKYCTLNSSTTFSMLFLEYPLDSNNKAFNEIDNDGNYHYLCPLNKW